MLSPVRESGYPNLRKEGYNVTSRQTLHKKVRYNCVAWAAIGDKEKWWQAGIGPSFYWPKGILDDESFQSYMELFELLGYKPTANNNRRLEVFYEKVALYAFPDGEFAHVSYQLFGGWTSKLGDWQDIRHKTLKALEGGDYGDVKIIMKRLSGLRGFLARACFVLTSKLWTLKRPD